MNIGIASPLDISCLTPYLNRDSDKELIIDNSFNSVATSVHTLIFSLIEEGHYVKIFTLSKNNSFIIKGKGIEIHGVKRYNRYPIKYLWADFINASLLRKNIKNHLSDLDVLHANWTYSYAWAASFYTRELPVFCTVRDWASYIWKIESLKNKITWSFKVLMNNLVFKNYGIHFISNSPYTAAKIKEKYNISTPIIPNPIKDSFLKLDDPLYPKNLELVCVSSSNDRRKNVKTLLLAFRCLKKKYPDANLSLIGSPFVKGNEIIELWRSEGLLKNVNLVGSVKHDELKRYFDKARIFVTPSLEETFGNTLLESIARKVPVVAGQYSGAIPYVLHHGKAGFLCDVSNVDALYTTILEVHEDEVKIKKVVNDAYKILLSEYLGKDICKKHVLLYKQYI